MNNIIKFDLFDNTSDKFVLVNPTKQQVAFFPKEESQMFQGKSYDNLGNRTTGWENDPITESENNDTRAFVNSIKTTDVDPFNNTTDRESYFDVQKIQFNGSSSDVQSQLQHYRYGMNDINSSHTPTDYIGAINVNIPFIINDIYADFRYLSESSSEFVNLYDDEDTNEKITSILNGIQRLRIPINIFNTVLTDDAEIENNGGDDIIKNFGKYYVYVTPKFIESNVIAIDRKEHYPFRFRSDNAIDESSDNEIHLIPSKKRRTIYKLDKSDFTNTVWDFENNPRQSGRLYASVVEVWDSTLTILKQTKIMTENQFNFSDLNKNFECVLQPDIFGYDVDSQDIAIGDVLRIYPRETYFNNLIIEVNYKNEDLEVSNLISFLVNDMVRDMTTGIFEVYDDNGFEIDEDGSFNGNVKRRYQIFQKDKFEARKTLKK